MENLIDDEVARETGYVAANKPTNHKHHRDIQTNDPAEENMEGLSIHAPRPNLIPWPLTPVLLWH